MSGGKVDDGIVIVSARSEELNHLEAFGDLIEFMVNDLGDA